MTKGNPSGLNITTPKSAFKQGEALGKKASLLVCIYAKATMLELIVQADRRQDKELKYLAISYSAGLISGEDNRGLVL